MNRAHIGLLAMSFVLGACSGDGSSSFGGQGPVSDSFPITADNGVQTTRASYQAAVAGGGFADFGGVPLASAPTDGAAIAVIAASPQDVLIDSISLIPFGPIVEPCLGGTGSSTLSGDLASLDTLTVGDTFLIEYELCDDGEGSVIDGIIDLRVREFSGDLLGAYVLAMDADVIDFSVMTGTDTVTADGDATVSIDTTQPLFVRTSVSGSEMSETTNAVSQTLYSYNTTTTLDANQVPEEFTMDAAGTLEHSSLPGNVTYSTPTLFRGFVPDNPHEGSLLVEGENSTARLTVLDATTVRVEIDNNNDEVIDYSEDMSWDAFLGNDT